MSNKNIAILEQDRKSTRSILIGSSFILGGVGAITFIPLLMSVMAFDSPGSEKSILTWVIFLCLFLFSPMCFIALFLSWVFYSSGKYKIAKRITALPLINVAILATLFFIGILFNEISKLFKFFL